MYRKYKEPAYMPDRDGMRRLLKASICCRLDSVWVPLEDSLGRICAADVRSMNTLPNAPVSVIDGIAVRYEDFAGDMPDTSAWQEGSEFYFSNTGVAIRDEYDTVIPVEDIDYIDGRLSVLYKPEQPGAYVGAAGKSLRENELLVPRGTRIAPRHMGLLAAGGILHVEVLRKPVVAILPTGDELVAAGVAAPRGKNVESNSHMLAGYVAQWGGQPVRYPIIRDDQETLVASLEKAVRESDVTLLIGGSSKGTMDYSLDALKLMGEVVVEELGHGPGKHASLCLAGDKIILGMPGPFMGAQLVAELYLRVILDSMLLQPDDAAPSLKVVLEHDLGNYEIDFVETLSIIRREGVFYAEAVWKTPKTWAEAMAMTKGRFYHKKGTVLREGDCIQAELLVPLAEIMACEPD